MYAKNKITRSISALIFVLMVSVFCVSDMAKGATSNDNKTISNHFNVMPDKVWKISFNKEVDLNSINSDNVKIYEKSTGKAISINIIKDYNDYKSFKIRPSMNYIKGKGYRIEIMNIKTKEGDKTLKQTNMDFYIKNIYSGLPGENGLVIVQDKAYAVDYFKTHTKEANDIVFNKNYDIYYTYDINYDKINSIFNIGYSNEINVLRKYNEIAYIDPAGKKSIYKWDWQKEEYILMQPSLDVDIVVRGDIKLVTVRAWNIIGVPDGRYFKIKHSNLIYNIGDTVAYTASANWEEISILTQDKTVIATGYLDVGRINTGKCYLKIIDDYGLGNFSGNINNNGIAAQDSEGFIYYVNAIDKEKLYKIGLDGMYNKKITENKVQYLNVSQDYIYYSDYTDGGKLYKSKTDGSKREKICDDKAAYITLSGEYIYYSNHSKGGKLYKIRKDGLDAIIDKDGTKHGKLVFTSYGDASGTTDEVAYINIVGDWIYYSNYSDGHKPYVINKEGTYRGKLCDEWATSIQVYGDWIYYSSGSGVISKVRKDGSGSIIPIKAQTSEYNKGYYYIAFEDWIYYSNKEDKNKLYKIKTDGSGEKVKLCEDSVGYINIIGRDLYYNTLQGKFNKLSIDTDGTIIPQELGKIVPNDQVNSVDNLKVFVDYADVNQPLSWIENKYLPEKAAGIMVNNTMQQLVVIWDRNPKNIIVKDGVFTYKGNLIGYNKTITMALTIPSEMLNATNEIYVYNNGGKNDTVEVTGVRDGRGVRIQDGDVIKAYSDEACINNLGKATVGRDRKAILQKLDLDPYGKSIWLTVMRKGKAESKPTELKQTEASIIREDVALDDDKVGLGVDGRDLRITNWIPSKINSPISQYIYLVPSKTPLDMKGFKPVDGNLNNYLTSWNGSKYNRENAFKSDSKNGMLKAGKYDVYIAAEYKGYGTADVEGNLPLVYGKTSCDTPAIVNFDEEKLPIRPTIKKQIVKGRDNGGVVILDKAPAIGETAWLVPIDVAKNKPINGWKAEDGISDPFRTLVTAGKDVMELVGDGATKEMAAPKGLSENVDYKLFIVNSVGASVESASVVTVDNKTPSLTISSNVFVTYGDKIDVKSDENGKIYILKYGDDSSTVERLESAVKAKTGKVLSVTAGTTYKLDTSGLEASLDTPVVNYNIVVVDGAGNISTGQDVSVYIRVGELTSLIAFAENCNKDALSATEVKSLETAIASANNILQKVPVLQSEITRIFNNLKSTLIKVRIKVDPDIILDLTPTDFSGGYPKIKPGTITSSSFEFSIKMNDKCDVYYLVLPKQNPEPSMYQIMGGSMVNVTEVDSVKDINVSTLAPNTDYKVYLVAKDDAYNMSKIKSISLKTTTP